MRKIRWLKKNQVVQGVKIDHVAHLKALEFSRCRNEHENKDATSSFQIELKGCKNLDKTHVCTICTTAFEHIMKLYKLALVELVGCVKTLAKRSQHCWVQHLTCVWATRTSMSQHLETGWPNAHNMLCSTMMR